MTLDVDQLLDRIAGGYRTAHADLYGMSSAPPDATAKTGKPQWRPPRGDTPHVRGNLVEAARLIHDAHWQAGGPQTLPVPGFGRSLGARAGVRSQHTDGSDNATALAVDAIAGRDDITLTWRAIWTPDSFDVGVSCPDPQAFRRACLTTAGRTAAIRDQTHLDMVYALIRLASSAVARAGGYPDLARRVQHRNVQELKANVCGHADCGSTNLHARGLCRVHYNQTRYQERKEQGLTTSR